jgi:hypothetical protein
MAINQTIETPLTLFSGSLSAHTVAGGATQGQLMTIISSSLPKYNPPFWNYKIKTETTYVTASAAVNINELVVNLTSTTQYFLIIGYYGIGCSSVTTGVRVGYNAASIRDGNITVEVPDTKTSYVVNWDGTTGAATTTFPSNDVNNFYLARHIIIGKPTATSATIRPTINVSAAGAGVTASIGPSVVFWTSLPAV